MDLRELKALELAARSKIVFHLGAWLVPSQSTGATYRVALNPPACPCEDFQLRAEPCKHIIAARLVAARDHDGEPAPAIDTDAVPKRPTYRQDWPNYDRAQMTEKARFQELLFDLIQGVEDPPQPKTGRRRTLMRDMVFSACLKVYTTFSLRRFACDLKDAFNRGFLTFLMHSVHVGKYMESDLMTPALTALIERSALPLRAVESTLAPDSTGFGASRFHKWHDEKYGRERSGRAWVKAHAIVGTKTNVITSVIVGDENSADSPHFRPLVERTAANGFKIGDVPADKAYLSHDNLNLVAALGGTAYIPFKSNSQPGEPDSVWGRMYAMFVLNRQDFLKRYHQRSNVESTFAMVKAKFRDNVRSKTPTAMKNEVLLKCLAHNLCVVHQAIVELGIEAAFWPAAGAGDRAVILKLPG